MGWSLRKSWRLLPGIRISLSKSGPRLSAGIPGARASIDMNGKTRIYGGKGAIRFQRTVTIDTLKDRGCNVGGILTVLRRFLR